MSAEKARELLERIRTVMAKPEQSFHVAASELARERHSVVMGGLPVIIKALERMAGLRISDEMASSLRAWRGIEETCRDCGGSGRKAYPSTAVWRGGIGGCAITDGVCDRCWGTGDEQRKGANLRNMTRETEDLRRKLDAALADSEQLRKDAERYRWMRDHKATAEYGGFASRREGYSTNAVRLDWVGEDGSQYTQSNFYATLDEAIDELEVPE